MEARLKRARSNWQGAILVCGKCMKKVDGGFGKKRRTPLVRLLRQLPGFGKGRKAQVGVIETKCLGLCPKRAVALVDTRWPGVWFVVPVGAEIGTLSMRLGTAEEADVAPLPVTPGLTRGPASHVQSDGVE